MIFRDVPEIGFVSGSDTPTRGEICVFTSNVDYFNDRNLLQSAMFLHQGRYYFRTGDLGEITTDGKVEIIGRLGSVVKAKL